MCVRLISMLLVQNCGCKDTHFYLISKTNLLFFQQIPVILADFSLVFCPVNRSESHLGWLFSLKLVVVVALEVAILTLYGGDNGFEHV